jgi:hypothetical protein
MADIEMFNDLQKRFPVYNQDILDGLAYRGLDNAKELIDQTIACAERSYPADFEFNGSSICSPQEAYSVMSSSLTRSDRSTPSIDLAQSDVYMVKYQFSCNGVPLYPRYFCVPYVRRGGLITITGKQFAIGQVLTDPGLSIGQDFVFIRMSRAPVTFKRLIHTVMKDGVEYSEYVAYSWLHHRSADKNKKSESDTIVLGKAMSTLPHYLFCRYGFKETFRRFAYCDVAIVTEEFLKENPVDSEKYVVVTSSKSRPSALKTRVHYPDVATNYCLVIPRAADNQLTMVFALGFFYMVDLFPQDATIEDLLEAQVWKCWMGYILFGDQMSIGKLVENVESHLISLDDYVDIEVRKTLLDEENLDVDDLYEFFAYILVQIDHLIDSKAESIGSMYGKRLVTSQYVLRDIYEQIFRCLFEITNNRKRKHTADDYNKILGKFFMPTIIFNLRKTSSKPFMSSVSTPGDNMFFRITSRLVMQAQTSAGRKSQNLNVNDVGSWLDSSIAEAGNHLILPKHSPLGRNTINPTVLLDEKNTICRKEHMKPITEWIDSAIGRD